MRIFASGPNPGSRSALDGRQGQPSPAARIAGAIAILLAGILACLETLAYESYHDPTLNGGGYCATCHPGFVGGRHSRLHALHAEGVDPLTFNCLLCHTGASFENPLVMWSKQGGLGCMGCHGRDYGETVESDYRGLPTLGKPKASGYGLRKLHLRNGITVCQDCHADVPQQAILPENVNPPYYARSDVALAGEAADACANEDSLNDADSRGLDNDGDLQYERDDADCFVAEPDINLSPSLLDFGFVGQGDSLRLTTRVENLGTADLTVRLITRCGGTGGEFTWTPATFTVRPAQSHVLAVTYAPSDLGHDLGCLEVASDDPDEPVVRLAIVASSTTAAEPNIVVNPLALEFGSVGLGTTRARTTELWNTGTQELTIWNIGFCTGSSRSFSWTPSPLLSIPPGDREILTVRYKPQAEVTDLGCLEIVSSDPDSRTVSLTLRGTGTTAAEPRIVLEPPALDFGTVSSGDTQRRTVRVWNLGRGPLSVSDVVRCAGTTAEFTWEPQGSVTIPSGGSETLIVTYSPVDSGRDAGCLEIASNDPAAPTVLDLAGNGGARQPDIVLDPSWLDFGTVSLAGAASRSARVWNLGTTSLTISGIVPCAGTSAEFTWTPLDPVTILPGGSETLTVTYAPTERGTDAGCLEILSDDPDTSAIQLGLVGAAVSGGADIVLDPTSLDFGSVFRLTRKRLTTRVLNMGQSDLVISSLVRCAGTTGEFTWDPPTSTIIAPGGSAALTVTYTPLDAGVDAGCIEISSNDPDAGTVELGLIGSSDFSIVCGNCHGSPVNPAPPVDTFGATDVSLVTVGAHQSHLGTSAWHREILCRDCHRVPAEAADPGHIDAAPAELTWSALASADGALPVFDRAAESCSGVYCHGPTLIPGGQNTEPIWTIVDGTQAACGTCHGLPPDAPHPPSSQCDTCHGMVVDGVFNFVDPSLHINGTVDVVVLENHPQATTDCSNCHLNPETQQPDLLGIHGSDCVRCHPVDVRSTILGPLGTFNGECWHCHNPGVPETGNLETPTRGHRCVVCHGEQRSTANAREIHRKHADKADCAVCHGFIPDAGTQIGSGSRLVCTICHERPRNDSIRTIHKKHASKGLSCLECHNGERPAVDVAFGPLVGGAAVVCDVCHNDRDPWEFDRRFERLHEKHVDERLDCGACHMAANLQEDRDPMPGLDDPVRALVDRRSFNECFLCHEGGESASPRMVHEKHVNGQWQWCHNCHEGDDPRPVGQHPPITEPSLACLLCHDNRPFAGGSPFQVHRIHSGKTKCYSCHQLTPPLFDWPEFWLAR